MQAIWIGAVIVVTMLASLWTGAGWAQALRVVGFNVESGGARPDVVDDLIAEAQGVDLWGFSEVQDAIWATLFAQAAAEGETGTFAPILGTTGGGDRLLIVYHQRSIRPGPLVRTRGHQYRRQCPRPAGGPVPPQTRRPRVPLHGQSPLPQQHRRAA